MLINELENCTASRRKLLKQGVAVAASAVLPPAFAQDKKKVRIAGIQILAYAPLLVAKELGYFDQEGLDVEIVKAQSGNAAIAAMLSGSADLAGTNYINPLALAIQGKSVKSVVGMEMASVYAFVVKPDMKIPPDNVKALVNALKGKRIGVASLGSGADLVATGILSEHGGGANGVIKVAVGTGGTAVAAMRAGGVDAAVVFEPDLTQIVKAGVGKVALDLRNTKSESSYGRLPATTIQATTEWINKNPAVAASVVRAVTRANKTLQSDGASSMKALLSIFPGTDPADMKSMYEGERASFRSDMPKDQFDAAQAVYLKQGTISKAVGYDDVIATQFASLWK